jgi:Icc-related predicted phosphoesterase
MTSQRVSRILCAADPRGSREATEALAATAADRDVHAVAVVGDLAPGGGRDAYRAVFRALGGAGLPTFWVPGPADAPVAQYLREAHNAEVVHPELHGIHGTAAFAPDGHLLFAGIGGAVDDDPDAPRDETGALRYPRWEAEYRLKIVAELGEHEPVLLFATPPAHKGAGGAGSDVVAELVGTYRARLVVCGGVRGTKTLGRTLVVAPGSLAAGQFAVADLQTREIELHELAAAVR